MPITILYGQDDYRRNRALKQLRDASITPELGTLGYHLLEKPSLSELTEALQATTFALGGLPFYEVQHFELLGKAASKDKDKALAFLMEVLETQADQKIIVFVSDSFDRKYKLPKWLNKHGDAQNFEVMPFWKGQEVAQLLQHEVGQLGIQITHQAAFLLADHLGHALRPLVSECEKLHAYTHGEQITEAHVHLLTLLDEGAFPIIEAWLQGRVSPQIVHQLKQLFTTTHPLQFLSLLQRQLAYHHRLKLGLSQGWSIDDIAKSEGKKSYPVQKDLQGIRQITLETIESRMIKVLQAEFDIKRGRREATQAIEGLMFA
jgi:DNA polymerase III subunit delta